MFKKSLASLVAAAVIVAGPGHLSINAAAQTMRAPVTGVSVTPSIGAGLTSPSATFNTPVLAPSALTAPSLSAANVAVPAPVVAAPAAAVAVKPVAAVPAAEAAKAFPQGSYAALRAIQLPAASKGEQGGVEAAQALNRAFDNSGSAASSALEVVGAASVVDSGLGRAEAVSAKSPAAVERAAMNRAKSAIGGEAAIVSLAKRAWNAILGMLGIGVKKMETPEVMAQRLIDQLNAQKPVYNRKVQEASTLVEKLKLQVQGEEKKVAELEQGITALLSDSDPANDIMASGMINQQKTLNASIASTKEQITLAEGTLQGIKEERARFFSEREEMLAKIQSGLTKAKSAEIQKQIAELKGGFQVGDLKDNMDRFEDAVNDKVADAKGTVDSVESNPDQILKKAKDSLRSQEVQDEIAKRKAAIEAAKKDKGQTGGKAVVSTLQAVGVSINVLTAVWAGLNTGWIAGLLGAGAAMGFIVPLGGIFGIAGGVFGEKVMKTSGAKTAGMAILGGVIGVALALTGVGFAGYVGWTVASNSAAIWLGATALVGSLLNIGWKSIFGAKKSAQNDKDQTGGLVLELGIAAAVVAVVAAVSAPFRGLLARAWNALLGIFGLGVKKMETPEVMAQRIIDQLNAQKPVYNRKVQEASTLVEKLRLQIEKQEAQSKELDRSVTAILSDSDPLNDVMAESLLNQKKTVDASTVMTKEQLEISEKTLVSIKEERASFFSEREEMLAKIQAGLTKSKSAEIQKQIAELKGGFQVGDLKDNMDRFEDAVNDKVADAKGTVDSVESNPDQILKKAKDSLKNQEVQDEIAKRKAAIEAAKKAKGETGGDASQSKALGYFAKAIGIGFALISPWISSAVFALLGLVAIAMAPEQGRWFGRQLAVIGLGTLLIGGAAALATAKLGLAVGAFGVGISFVVPAGIALAAGVIAALRARAKTNGVVAAASSTPAGSSVVPAPAPSIPEATATPADTSAAPSAAKASFSIKPLLNLLSRAWNALLGLFGMGVKKMETPEIMAQRLIDQLNDAKPVYNNKVREASTLVEKLRQQIQGEEAKIAEFEKTITAILSDNNAENDIQAAGLLNSQKTLQASVAASKEQLASAEKSLEGIKEERARFFAEREETLAKIQSGLTKVKSAEIQKQIAELKGGFQIGDLKDNMDRFDNAVNDKIADAKGATDSVESNPDQVLKKAKDSLRTQEIADELAKRKAAIEAAKKDKGQTGGDAEGAGSIAAILGYVGLLFGANSLMGLAISAGASIQALLIMAVTAPFLPLLAAAGVEWAYNRVSPSSDKGDVGGKLGAVDVTYFSAMGVMLGYGLTLLTGFWPVAAAAALAGVFGLLTAKVSRNLAGNGRSYDYTGNIFRASAIGMGLTAVYSLAVGAAFLPALAGAAILGAAAVWAYRSDAAQEKALKDKEDAGGSVRSVWSFLNDGTPFGSYREGVRNGQVVRLYGWSLSGRTFFQSVVLGLVAGPIVWALGMATLPWAIGGMAAAPFVVDLLKPTLLYTGRAANDRGETGGLVLELGIAAAVVAVVAAVSAPFRNLLARAWNALLGIFGLGVKKMETPEVMAQRIIDQLNAQKPVYNRKVQEASTLVEKLRLQIEKQSAQSAELDRSVTAILSDSDPLNDVMAESLLNQKKTVDASTAMTKEQLTISEKTLESIKEERARFFSEREEMLAKIQAGLTKSKSAEIQKQIAELKGGFQVGDLKDNMDRFEDAVNDKVADAKGTVDSVESNPDQILKKAKDSLKNQEVQDEIAKRKAAIEAAKKAKEQTGGAVGDDKLLTAAQAEQGLLSKTYSWMTLGLGITAAAAQAAIVTGAATTILASLPMMIGLAVLQLALVIGLSLAIKRLSPGAALGGFLLYSGLNGLFLAPLVAMFTAGSVAASFLVTAGMFGTMAFLGHTTKVSLNSVGSYGMMALTGIILASIVNMFMHSTGLAAILTYATILVFVGLTAYDAQKIKEMAAQQGKLSKDDVSRIAVMGALTLYLDFINLFIQILKIMGKAKSKD